MTGPAGLPTRPNDPPSGADPAGRRRDALLIGLTFAAGGIDAVSYLGLGQIFTANMTGNLVFLALALGDRSLPEALHSGAALLVFSVGAIIAGRILIGPRPTATWPRHLTRLLWGQFACLAVFAVLWGSLGGAPGATWVYLLIGLSAFGMGLQNAVARYLGVPGLTTTVVTGALTGFMVELPALGISGPTQRRAAWTILALFTGATTGAILMVYARDFAPILTATTVGLVAAVAYVTFDRTTPVRA